jgi:hypothetical protein
LIDNTFYFVAPHEQTPLLPHQKDLQVSEGSASIKEYHQLVKGKLNRFALLHQSQVILDEDVLLSSVLERKELKVLS